jgi:outer membrane PBP1 activator LpoA protein
MELRTNVKEMEELAIDVAVENLDATKKLETSLAEAEKCNAAKEQRLAKSAAHRLAKVKQSSALLSELQSTLDEEQYKNDMVLLENEWLKEQVYAIGNELIDAYHTIEVSNELRLLLS